MKKIVSILATLVLALQLTTVYADGATISLSNATGKPGDTVDITIDLADCDIWSNIGVTTTYDGTALELTKAKNAAPGTAVVPGTAKLGDIPIVTTWTDAEGSEHNGKMATLTFKIKEDAAPGVYNLTLAYYTGKNGTYTDGKNVNYYMDEDMNKTSLGLSYVSGSITVESAGPTEPTLAAEKVAGGVKVTAASPEAITGKFIVAAYDAYGLVDVEVLDADAEVTSSVTGATVKVMWWDSLTGLTSIAPAVTLN